MIILIGLPGSGKSTVGRQLARRFSFSFVDSDHVIEQAVGCSIREFFEREGEERFRDVEQETLARLVADDTGTGAVAVVSGDLKTPPDLVATSELSALLPAPPAPVPGVAPVAVPVEPSATAHLPPASRAMVLSTGGGAVLRPANRAALRGAGQVVYLRATPEDLYRRLRHDQNRPLLQGTDPLQKLRDLYTARDRLYRETAHFAVETGRPSVATLTNMIAMQLELAGVVPRSSGA